MAKDWSRPILTTSFREHSLCCYREFKSCSQKSWDEIKKYFHFDHLLLVAALSVVHWLEYESELMESVAKCAWTWISMGWMCTWKSKMWLFDFWISLMCFRINFASSSEKPDKKCFMMRVSTLASFTSLGQGSLISAATNCSLDWAFLIPFLPNVPSMSTLQQSYLLYLNGKGHLSNLSSI